ncbi:MAG: hydrogenase maturation nickel metallochaperone HypA [Lachnospiraceae bacterium]|nr:hydrogenase maturation nickel metallochaperone HypA [Lachnospiraceae bacterium]
MHELGVTFYVVRDVKKVAEENGIDRIDFVTLEIGEVSGVINEQLTDCWNWARKKEKVTENTELIIENLEAVSFCECCQREFGTIDYGKTCPYCGGGNTYLLRGNEFNIKEIGVYDNT